MAETTAEAPTTEPQTDQTAPAVEPDLGDAGKKALDAERKNARAAAKERDALAARLKEFEDRDKTEAQKVADRATAAEQARDAAIAETLRYKAAATYKVDANYFDLLGSGTEEEINDRAKRVGGLIQVKAENEQLKAELDAIRGVQSTPRPVDQLKPGAIATGVDDSYPADWFPQSRART